MPREYIAGRTPADFQVVVGWQRDCDVQVATIDRSKEKLVTGPEVRFEGLYADLDRRGINELIRALRKARDQAYGRDE